MEMSVEVEKTVTITLNEKEARDLSLLASCGLRRMNNSDNLRFVRKLRSLLMDHHF